MDETLISVASLENAWARLSANPEYQRSVTTFFKGPTFYINLPGLYVGTSKANGRRAVYCDKECVGRLSRELVARIGSLLVAQAPPADALAEEVEEVQALQLQSAEDVKAMLKELKRVARHHRQNRQLAAAQVLLLNARRWTTPFTQPGSCSVQPAGAKTTAATAATAAAPLHAAEDCGASCRHLELQSMADAGARCGANGGAACTAVAGQPPLLHSHPLGGSAVWEVADGGEAEDGGSAQGLAAATAPAPATAAANGVCAAAATATAAALRFLHLGNGTADPATAAACPSTPRGAATPSAASADVSEESSAAASSSATPHWAPNSPKRAAMGEALVAGCGGAATPPHPTSESGAAAAASGAGPRDGTDASGSLSYSGGGDVCGAVGGGEGVLVVCCCIDLEWWERDSSRVTEIGWTMWDNLTCRLESRHHIVAEHEALVNRIHVPDHKHDFLFGASSSGSLAQGAAALQRDMEHYGEAVWAAWCGGQQQQQQGQEQGQREELQGSQVLKRGRSSEEGPAAGPPLAPPMQLVVVGHGLSGDLKALSSLLGVVLPPGTAILDTADLAWAALGGGTGQERTAMSLRLLLKTLDIAATKLHNGGNDARYTMEAMLALAAIEPVPFEQ